MSCAWAEAFDRRVYGWAGLVKGMADYEREKALAATRAVEMVSDGMLVGLGSGSTAFYAIRKLGERVRAGLRIDAVATSGASGIVARRVGLRPLSFQTVSRVDLTIDGVDEIDPSLNAIKGGGGALLKEKIVASASDKMVVVGDSRKPVEQLGRSRLPIVVLPFACAWVERAVRDMGLQPERRTLGTGSSFMTDEGNFIFDLACDPIVDPDSLAAALAGVPGIVEHGLFLAEIDIAFIARGTEVEELHRSKPQG